MADSKRAKGVRGTGSTSFRAAVVEAIQKMWTGRQRDIRLMRDEVVLAVGILEDLEEGRDRTLLTTSPCRTFFHRGRQAMANSIRTAVRLPLRVL